MTLPYLLDNWMDFYGQGRIIIQMQIPSGVDTYEKFQWRVSTEKDEFVVSFPMLPFLSCSDYAFEEVTREIEKFKGMSDEQKKFALQNHPKTIARVNLVKKMKGNNSTKNFTYPQRIKLPECVQATPVTELEDKIFFWREVFCQQGWLYIFACRAHG